MQVKYKIDKIAETVLKFKSNCHIHANGIIFDNFWLK